MTAPALVMSKRGHWTPASLRKHYQYRISTLDPSFRLVFAYGVLSEICQSGPGTHRWTAAQRRAIADGLDRGMKDAL